MTGLNKYENKDKRRERRERNLRRSQVNLDRKKRYIYVNSDHENDTGYFFEERYYDDTIDSDI